MSCSSLGLSQIPSTPLASSSVKLWFCGFGCSLQRTDYWAVVAVVQRFKAQHNPIHCLQCSLWTVVWDRVCFWMSFSKQGWSWNAEVIQLTNFQPFSHVVHLVRSPSWHALSGKICWFALQQAWQSHIKIMTKMAWTNCHYEWDCSEMTLFLFFFWSRRCLKQTIDIYFI